MPIDFRRNPSRIGALVNRPSAPSVGEGTLYLDQTTGQIERTDTTQWVPFNPGIPSTGPGTTFVTTTGSDANNGLSWGSAKLTIAAAIAALPAAGGIVQLGMGDFTTSGETSIDRSCLLRGMGLGLTRLLGGVGSGYTLKRFGTSTTIDNIRIEDLTIDLNGVASASAVGVEYVTNFAMRRVRIANSVQWAVRVGVVDGSDATTRNNGVLIEDCIFDGQGSTTEALLLFNSSRVTVRRCYFTNLGASAYGIGLYQNLERVLIDDCVFNSSVGTGLYYSLSTNNITVRDCRFISGIKPVIGANQSDNGAFGAQRVVGLSFEGCYFTTTISAPALQLGAVRDAKVIGCLFINCQQTGLIISNGNAPVNTAPDHIQIIGCTFRNGNQNANFYIIHPAVMITSTGNLYIEFIGCDVLDDQVTKTQRYPVSFEGAITPSYVDFIGCQLLADTANSATSVAVDAGATIGSYVRLFGCRDVSTTLPAGVQSYNSATRDPLGVAAITVTASPFTYTNADGVPEAVQIDAGTVSDISKNATTIFTSTGKTVYLDPGEAVTVTYTVAPTMTKDRK